MTNIANNQTASPFKKHQIISFKKQGDSEPTVGFIEALTKTKARVIFEYNGTLSMYETKKGMTPDRLLGLLKAEPCDDAAVPPQLQKRIDSNLAAAQVTPVKKGDVVSYTYNGATRTGRVLKGGKRPLVSLSSNENLEVSASQLAPATLPYPDPELKEWAVSSWKSHGPRTDGEAMTATVTRNGNPVIEIIDQGDGGPCTAYPTGTGTQRDIASLEADLNAYLEANDISVHEPVDLWVDYAWALQPTGLTFADYTADFKISPKGPSQ